MPSPHLSPRAEVTVIMPLRNDLMPSRSAITHRPSTTATSMNESSITPTDPTAERPPPRTICIQLPDLLSACAPFELRTNRHCKAISQASERWLHDSGVILPSMKWRSAKVGLLVAACYPTADAPQLGLIADVLGLLVYRLDRRALGRPTDDDDNDIFSL